MAGEAGIGRIGIIAVVAIGTTGTRVCAVQNPIIVVDRERGRCPTRCGSMTHGTICWDVQRRVLRVGSLVKICGMASGTLFWRTSIPGRMALHTIRGKVCPGQWEIRGIVVKSIVSATGRMAGKAGRTVVSIASNSGMTIVRFGVGMARGTGKFRVIRRVRMAIRAAGPFAFVFAAINRKKLGIVVKRCGHPSRFAVTTDTIGGEPCRHVIRVAGRIVVGGVASRTSIGSLVVISVMAGSTVVGNQRVRPI